MQVDIIKAAEVDISHYSGDVFDLWLSFHNSDQSPRSMAGHDLLMQIKKTKASGIVMDELSTPEDIYITGDEDNEIKCSKVVQLPEGEYFYDIEDTTDKVTILKGILTIEGDVTRYD